MDESEFLDRRIFERISAELPLQFLETSSNKQGLALTRNVSAKGLCVWTEESLQPNDSLEMWLQIPSSQERVYTRGRVVWSEELWSNQCKAGISLEKAELMGMSIVLRNLFLNK